MYSHNEYNWYSKHHPYMKKLETVGHANIQTSFQPMTINVNLPGIRQRHKAQFDTENLCIVVFRPGELDAIECGQQEYGLPLAKEKFYGRLGSLTAPVCEEIILKKGEMIHQAVAKNKGDTEKIKHAYSSSFHESDTETHTTSEDPVKNRISEIMNDPKQQKEFTLEICEFFTQGTPADPLYPPGSINQTYHPLQGLPVIAEGLHEGEMVVYQQLIFPADQRIYKYFPYIAEKSRTQEVNKQIIISGGTFNQYQYKYPATEKASHPRTIFSWRFRAAIISKKYRADDIRQAAISPYSDYLHGGMPFKILYMRDFIRRNISVNKIRGMIVDRLTLSDAGLFTGREMGYMFPFQSYPIITQKHARVKHILAHPIMVMNNDIVLGTCPVTGKVFSVPSEWFMNGGVLIVGNQGSGKTQLMKNIINQFISKMKAGSFLDFPLNEDLNGACSVVPPDLYQKTDVISLNSEKPVGFNLLVQNNTIKRQVGGHTTVIKKSSEYSSTPISGPYVTDYLFNTILLMFSPPFIGTTFKHIQKFLRSATYRNKVLNIAKKYPELHELVNWFISMGASLLKRHTPPTHAAYSLLEPFCREGANIFCQMNAKYNADLMVNENRHCIFYGGRGEISLSDWVTQSSSIKTSVISTVTGQERSTPFVLCCDEVSLYANPVYAEAITKGRGSRLVTVASVQNISQLYSQSTPVVRDSFLSLPIISFRVSPRDAAFLTQVTQLPAHIHSDLNPYEMLVRVEGKTYHLKSLPPLEPVSDDIVDVLRKKTEQRFGGEKPVFDDDSYFDAIFPKK